MGRRLWTERETALLVRTYPDGDTRVIARRLRRPVQEVYAKIAKLGIHKSAARIAAERKRQGNRLAISGAKSRFPKGHVPANKGLRRPGWYRGRMRETQFKKGQPPINTMPLWSFRWADGYIALKTGKRGPKPMDGWEYLHKLVWEQAHGPLPDWRVARIWWKDGDHSNCSLANLELVSAQEHMRRTTIHTKYARHQELKKTVMLAAALKRRISRMEKSNGKEQARRSA